MESNLAQLSRFSQVLILWLDCDREGENIAFEVIEVCQSANHNIQIFRARFSSIIKRDIVRALNNLVAPNYQDSMAVDTRQELDLRIGASFTRFQTLLLQNSFDWLQGGVQEEKPILSYGPCQFPTLGLIVQRAWEIAAFVSEPFWYIYVEYKDSKGTCTFNWDRGHLFDHFIATILYQTCLQNPIASVISVKGKEKRNFPPVPLSTLDLQKRATQYLRPISGEKVMKIAEELYQQGFISYPRTETDIFPNGFQYQQFISEQTRDSSWGPHASRLLSGELFKYPRKGGHDDKAHPPIHPLKYDQEAYNKWDQQKRRIYEFVVRSFLATCTKEALGFETTIGIQIGEETFHTSGLLIKERNWLEVYPYQKWHEKTNLPNLEEGMQFQPSVLELKQVINPSNTQSTKQGRKQFLSAQINEITLQKTFLTQSIKDYLTNCNFAALPICGDGRYILNQDKKLYPICQECTLLQSYMGQTSPPPKLAEKDLIHQMESHGIGTDATVAEHIQKQLDRGYAHKDSNQTFWPSRLGEALIAAYYKMGIDNMYKPELRGNIEQSISEVARGIKTKQQVLQEAIQVFYQTYLEASTKKRLLSDEMANFFQAKNGRANNERQPQNEQNQGNQRNFHDENAIGGCSSFTCIGTYKLQARFRNNQNQSNNVGMYNHDDGGNTQGNNSESDNPDQQGRMSNRQSNRGWIIKCDQCDKQIKFPVGTVNVRILEQLCNICGNRKTIEGVFNLASVYHYEIRDPTIQGCIVCQGQMQRALQNAGAYSRVRIQGQGQQISNLNPTPSNVQHPINNQRNTNRMQNQNENYQQSATQVNQNRHTNAQARQNFGIQANNNIFRPANFVSAQQLQNQSQDFDLEIQDNDQGQIYAPNNNYNHGQQQPRNKRAPRKSQQSQRNSSGNLHQPRQKRSRKKKQNYQQDNMDDEGPSNFNQTQRQKRNYQQYQQQNLDNDGIICPQHKQPCLVLTSKSAQNPNRQFIKCANDQDRCLEFKWLDEYLQNPNSINSRGSQGARFQHNSHRQPQNSSQYPNYQQNNNSEQLQKIKCYKCGQKGHYASTCPDK